MSKLKTLLSWSSGKDSCLSLLRLRDDPQIEVVGLLTTYHDSQVPFQHTPLSVVKAQAENLDLPLVLCELPEVFPPNPVYQSLVIESIRRAPFPVDAVAFGDMFCNGIAEYRRSYLEPAGWRCVFPLLGEPPLTLAQEILRRGIKTFITTVDTSQLDGMFVGRDYDTSLLAELPESIDPCGEDGEFHTLVYDAPGFSHSLVIERRHINRDGRFHYQTYCLVD